MVKKVNFTSSVLILLVLVLLGSCNNSGFDIATSEATESLARAAQGSNGYVLINGLQWADTAGNPIQAHGGGFINVGSYYYWFGENRFSDYSFKEVSCYRSTDLVNWEYRGAALNSGTVAELTDTNVERPKVIYNSSTGKYVMWMHWENGDHYGFARTAVASADSVEGPYTYHGRFRPYENSGITDHDRDGYMSRDCNLFVDDDGTAYFISSSNENEDLHLYRLTADYLNIDTLVTKLFEGDKREAPVLFKRNGYYFLLTSGCTGWSPNQGQYAVSTSLSSGWTSMTNIGDSTNYHSQPTYVIPVQGTSGTTYMYAGDRWAGAWSGPYLTSAYVWLPLSFPTNNTMSLTWYNTVAVDSSTGVITGSNNNFTFVNKNSGKAMEVENSSTLNGGLITQYTVNGNANQAWTMVYDNNGYHYLKNANSGKVLDVPAASTEEGKELKQWSQNGGDNQKWKIKDLGDGEYSIVNKNSELVVDVPASSMDNGKQLKQWSFNGGNNQRWFLAVD